MLQWLSYLKVDFPSYSPLASIHMWLASNTSFHMVRIVTWHNTKRTFSFSPLSVCPLFGNKLLSSSHTKNPQHILSILSTFCTNALRYTFCVQRVAHETHIQSLAESDHLNIMNICIMQTCNKNRVLPPSSEDKSCSTRFLSRSIHNRRKSMFFHAQGIPHTTKNCIEGEDLLQILKTRVAPHAACAEAFISRHKAMLLDELRNSHTTTFWRLALFHTFLEQKHSQPPQIRVVPRSRNFPHHHKLHRKRVFTPNSEA